MRNLISFLFLLCLVNSSCAQVKAIKQAKAYYYIRMPGNIPVDEKRNPIERSPDTVMNVYLEISGSLPQWKKAWKQNRSYNLTESKVNDSNLTVGKKLNGNEDVTMKRAKRNQFIVLELQPSAILSAPQAITNDEILLEGVLNAKTFFFKVKKPVQIASPEFM